MECVFCKISKGEIPSMKIYEDDEVFAFLDINPVSKGHTLVIPKKHCEKFDEADDDFFESIKKVAKAISKTYGDYNIIVNNGEKAGQEVMHLHVHLIPRTGEEDFSVNWNQGKYEEGKGEEELDKIKGNI